MTENEKRLSAEERKQKIRERYKGVDKEEDTRYRFRGEYVGAGENKMLLFQLDEPEMIKTEEITLPPQEPDILRPAKEVEDYNLVSSEELKALMQEAERIMEGWENTNE